MTTEQIKGNPYDSAHKITDPKLFAGRREELDMIEKEVARLVASPPISPNIAIIGERRVGKTSLLLRVEEMCDKYQLLGTIVHLSKTTAADPWEFWREIFDGIRLVAIKAGALAQPSDQGDLGFLSQPTDKKEQARKYKDSLQFANVYRTRSSLSLLVPPSHILREDLQLLCECITEGGYQGILLMLDEAHCLASSESLSPSGSYEIKQQFRHALEESERYGIVFAGEKSLGQLFTDSSEPFFAQQSRVISLENFVSKSDIAECALLPLSEDERQLMSPMTIDYLVRLSQGKPNQIRLICNSIYERYQNNEQEDLNITINVLEDVAAKIAKISTEYDLSKQIDTIRKLNSVDLEIIYNMTRYPVWSIEDIVQLDESFRGEVKSQAAVSRRARMLAEKRDKFIHMGLMSDVPERYVLVGDEFVYLYVRFWYEIQKYGDLKRELILGKGPPTPFGEKTEKLVKSLSWELGRAAKIVVFNHISRDTGLEDVVEKVKHRFSLLDKILKEGSLPDEDMRDILSECFVICELVSKPDKYHLLFLSVRNLENPRELVQIELYFESGETPIVIPTSTLKLIHQQADEAKILIEDSINFVVTLTDLPSLLGAVGGPSLDDLMNKADMVERWKIASVQHVVHARDIRKDSKSDEEQVSDQLRPDEWMELYKKGHPEEAEKCLSQKLSTVSDSHKFARLYNDRGYIRYGLNNVDLARKDLQRALNLHYADLPLTLLNLSVADIDEDNHESAIQRIEDALLITLGRESISFSHLRLRLLPSFSPLAKREKWEQHRTNILEASYINLAYALAYSASIKDAMDALQEGLSLMPNSVHLQHALARLHLFNMHANLADPIYEQLAQASITDNIVKQEVRLYVQQLQRRGRKRSKKRH